MPAAMLARLVSHLPSGNRILERVCPGMKRPFLVRGEDEVGRYTMITNITLTADTAYKRIPYTWGARSMMIPHKRRWWMR
jgi:hypothetical protein